MLHFACVPGLLSVVSGVGPLCRGGCMKGWIRGGGMNGWIRGGCMNGWTFTCTGRRKWQETHTSAKGINARRPGSYHHHLNAIPFQLRKEMRRYGWQAAQKSSG